MNARAAVATPALKDELAPRRKGGRHAGQGVGVLLAIDPAQHRVGEDYVDGLAQREVRGVDPHKAQVGVAGAREPNHLGRGVPPKASSPRRRSSTVSAPFP